jgi:hypothetical protein
MQRLARRIWRRLDHAPQHPLALGNHRSAILRVTLGDVATARRGIFLLRLQPAQLERLCLLADGLAVRDAVVDVGLADPAATRLH